MKEHVNPYTWYTTHTIHNKHMSHIPTHARDSTFFQTSMDLLTASFIYHWLQSMMILVILAFPLIFPLILDLQYLLFTYPSNNFFLWTHAFFFLLHSPPLPTLHKPYNTLPCCNSSSQSLHDINHSHFLIKKEIFVLAMCVRSWPYIRAGIDNIITKKSKN